MQQLLIQPNLETVGGLNGELGSSGSRYQGESRALDSRSLQILSCKATLNLSVITSVLSERRTQFADERRSEVKFLNPQYSIFRDQPIPGASPLRINTLLYGECQYVGYVMPNQYDQGNLLDRVANHKQKATAPVPPITSATCSTAGQIVSYCCARTNALIAPRTSPTRMQQAKKI